MPIYLYECEPCEHPFQQFFVGFKEAQPHMRSYECPQCGEQAGRTMGKEKPSFALKGHFPGKRIKEVDARKRRQESRLNTMLKKGETTKQQIDAMARMRDKYATQSPYTMDPTKDAKQDPNPEEQGTGYFDHEQEV